MYHFRPLHEACENCHIEVIRLLLSYGADPLLGTYAGQTPEELTEGPATKLLRLHIADVQGQTKDPWRFPSLAEIIGKFYFHKESIIISVCHFCGQRPRCVPSYERMLALLLQETIGAISVSFFPVSDLSDRVYLVIFRP